MYNEHCTIFWRKETMTITKKKVLDNLFCGIVHGILGITWYNSEVIDQCRHTHHYYGGGKILDLFNLFGN